MFRNAVRLPFRLLGIPVRLDTSFLLVLPLFAYLIGSQIPAYVQVFHDAGLNIDATSLQRGVTPYWLGLLGAIGLFLSVLVHELGHAVVARRYGVKVKEITLWFLGGVAQFEQMPRQRGAEAVVAIVGPLTSGALALLFGVLWRVAAHQPAALFILSYLTVTNAGLALFNLLPALPLDGGRVLRSLLALPLPHLQATRIAGAISAAVAVLLGIYGVLSLNLFLVAIAFFVYNAGRSETQAAILVDLFRGQRVRDLMTADPITVDPGMPLAQFRRLVHYRAYNGYPVVAADGHLVGYARIADAGPEDSEDGAGGTAGGTVGDIMVPAETIAADAPAMEALTRIGQGQLGRLAVVDGVNLVGMVSKTDLVRILHERTGGSTPGPKGGGAGGGRAPWPG